MNHPAETHRYTTTLSGVNIGPPGVFSVEDVRMDDIIHGLALTCRYNGQINRTYSVAEHSVLVSRLALHFGDEEAAIPALFHDAHEAYIGDLASPHKDMIEGWREFEESYETVVRRALGLPTESPVWERVAQYDMMMLHREVGTLRSTPPDWYDVVLDDQIPDDILPYGLSRPFAISLFKDHMAGLQFPVDSLGLLG